MIMSKTKGLADLNPRTVNPRTMTDEDRARLAKTLREFGDIGGVVLNTKSGQLVGGHQRVQDFRSLRSDRPQVPRNRDRSRLRSGGDPTLGRCHKRHPATPPRIRETPHGA